MNFILNLVNIFLHLDKNLSLVINLYGSWIYPFIFAIIFMETGFVITPFLPGDSLLFAAGTLSATTSLNIWIVFILLFLASILGDTLNYWIGHFLGPKVFGRENSRFFKKEYLDKTAEFYKKHGGKTIILARFIPIIRTFAPFVAGVGKMHYRQFISYNIFGGFLWVALFTFGGYLFGNLPAIKNNFHYVIVSIILISVLPPVYEFIKHKRNKSEIKEKDHITFKGLAETFKKEKLAD